MLLKPVNEWNQNTTISFSSIEELKKKIKAFELIFGKSNFSLISNESLKCFQKISSKKDDGYYSDSSTWEISGEDPTMIGNKFIIQPTMGYKWEVKGKCFGNIQPEETGYSNAL